MVFQDAIVEFGFDCKVRKLSPRSIDNYQKQLRYLQTYLADEYGMANAKARGAKVGRPKLTKEDIPQAFYRHYPAYAAGKMNLTELARVCDLSRPTVYKYIKMVG